MDKEHEAQQIQKYENRLDPPDDVGDEMSRWQAMREYVHTDAMLLDEEDAVGTNFILRHQHVATGLIKPTRPAPRIELREWMAPNVREMASSHQPMSYPQERLLLAKAHELVIDYQQQRGKLSRIIDGAIQDAQTLPVAWIKMRLQEDYELDPLGYGRHNDQLDSLARYERLRSAFDDGEFTDQCAEYGELLTLSNTIKAHVLGHLRTQLVEEAAPETSEDGEEVLAGGEALQARIAMLADNPEALVELSDLPEVAHYVGYVWQQVDPEDMRWDWNITRPEDLMYARWAAHRAFMTEAEIDEQWSLKDDDERIAGATRYDNEGTPLAGSGDDPEYGGKDPEERFRGYGTGVGDEQARGTKLAVWEYWDKVQGRVFRWVHGARKFLDSFVPQAAPARFFPFYAIIFNRVTGRLYGPSDTDLEQPLQDENNRLRTWQREGQRRAHPYFMVAKGLLRPSERARFEEAIPWSVTEVERPEEISKSLEQVTPSAYNPALYDRTPSLVEMQQMKGISGAALGAGNPQVSATADAIARQSMSGQALSRQSNIMEVYTDIFEAMAQINAQVLPAENVTSIAGPGAPWPEIDRQTVLASFLFEAEAVVDDGEERRNELKAWVDFIAVIKQLGFPLASIPVGKKLLQLMGIRNNLGRFIDVNMLAQTLGMPQPTDGAGNQASTAAAPEAQGDMGVAGGAPAGQGFDAPPAPESLPNAPA
jgi:hypothetical protein